MRYNTIFFDLDGTLTDPGVGITNCVIYALNKFGIEEERENLYRFIGPPLLESFEVYYGFSKEEAWKAVEYYRERFGDIGLFENEVYEGIPELLQMLKDRGCSLYVATSKPTEYSVRILEKFGLLKYFEYVSGSSMDEKNASKAIIIKNAMEKAKANREDILMIGDRKHDIIGAKNNNIMSVGVEYGYGDRQELETAGADYIVGTVLELKEFLDGVI